jgi:hypothetical protein
MILWSERFLSERQCSEREISPKVEQNNLSKVPSIVPEPYRFSGAGAGPKFIRKWQKNVIDPNIFPGQYHFIGEGAIAKIIHEFFGSSEQCCRAISPLRN